MRLEEVLYKKSLYINYMSYPVLFYTNFNWKKIITCENMVYS